ncbi:WD40 repeat domain-containing protein [Tessaracoccus sp. G1721]
MLPPQSRETLVETLVAARHAANLSIRRAATLAKVPPSTAQGWFEGRLPTPALTPHFLDLLQALGLIGSDDERAAWQRAVSSARSAPVVGESPYVGLRSYTAQEAAVYVGRERAYEALVEACLRPDAPRPIVVVGDSGAGKSSLLAAGLVGHACAPGGPMDGASPVSARVAELPTLTVPDGCRLLVVDQFEEAEALPPEERTAVFEALARLTAQVTCVVAITATAFGFAMRDERLAASLASPVLVGPLTPDEYAHIIEEPARRHGRTVAPDLVRLILRDLTLYGEPSPGTALPLLSSAMRRCWVAAQGATLTAAHYLATGGLWSALDEEAEAVYSALDERQQSLARRLMLALIQVDGDRILRRSIPLDDLDDDMSPVLDAFLGARLFALTGGAVAVSHDALLSRWERLRTWIEEERASLLIARRIQMAAQVWDEGGRQDDALMPVEAELWSSWARQKSAPLLSARENNFISSSLDLADTQQSAQADTIMRLRRRQQLAVAAAVIAITMLVVAVLAGLQSSYLREAAQASERSAQARQLALIADEVRADEPNPAGQLSVASLSLDESVESRSAVLKSAGTPLPTRATGPSGTTLIDHIEDADLTLRADSSGEVTLWRGGEIDGEAETLVSGGNQLFALKGTVVDGRVLALIGGQQTAAVWDLTGEPREILELGEDTVAYSAAWVGSTVLVGTLEGTIRRADLASADAPERLPDIALADEVAVTGLDATEDLIFAGGGASLVEVFRPDGSRVADIPVEGTVFAVDVSPDGGEVLVGTAQGFGYRYSTAPSGPALLTSLEFEGSANAVAHLGDRLLVGGSFGELREYTPGWELVRAYPEPTVVTSLDARGGDILAGATSGTVTAWRPDEDPEVLDLTDGRFYGVYSGSDAVLLGSTAGGLVVRRDGAGWVEMPVQAPPAGDAYTGYAILSEDATVLVNQTAAGSLVTLERTGDRFDAVDSMPGQEALADVEVSASGRYLALGYRGEPGYHLFSRDGDGWAPLAVLEDTWAGGSGFSPDEGLFVAMHVDGRSALLWRLGDEGPEKAATLTLADEAIPLDYAFSARGTLAVGDTAGRITVFDVTAPDEPAVLHELVEARSELTQVGFGRGGELLYAATREGRLWVWRLGDGAAELELSLRPGATTVTGAAWMDGHFVMALNGGRSVAWPDDPAAARDRLCEDFGSRISEEEWGSLVPGVPLTDGC